MRRMWINQPSTSQPWHRHHGREVLAEGRRDHGEFVRVWFTGGVEISAMISQAALSNGWPSTKEQG